jgi:hypothetical protein
MNHRRRREALTITQAIHINDRPCTLCHFRDRRDEDTATTADQKIASAGSEAVILYQRPIVSPNFEQPSGVRNDAWAMAAAERAGACPQLIVFWPLREPKTHMNIAAVAPA